MTQYYSKATGEHIAANDPADWMGRTEKPVPAYDAGVASAIFNGALGDWEIVAANTPTPEQMETAKIKVAESAIQSLLNSAAVAHGYDNILTASSYAALPVGAPFQAESAAFSLWRAQCWATSYQILAEVKAGIRVEPTAEELIAAMPVMELPQ